MGKTGWQVTAAIFASLSIMLGALAWNSSRALEVANAELRSRHELDETITPAPTSNLTTEQNGAVNGAVMRDVNHDLLRKHPSLTKCIDGMAFVKLDDEWRNNGPC